MSAINNNTENEKKRKGKVAVVGSGIAGLSALWVRPSPFYHRSPIKTALMSAWLTVQALTQDGFEVDLYEKEDRVGGDAHTIEYKRTSASPFVQPICGSSGRRVILTAGGIGEGKETCWVET